MPTEPALPLITRRTYLMVSTMDRTNCSYFAAAEAVSSVAIEHPDWDLDEQRSWQEWERRG